MCRRTPAPKSRHPSHPGAKYCSHLAICPFGHVSPPRPPAIIDPRPWELRSYGSRHVKINTFCTAGSPWDDTKDRKTLLKACKNQYILDSQPSLGFPHTSPHKPPAQPPMVKTGVSPPMGAQIIWKKLAYPLPWELRSYGKNWRIPSRGSSDHVEKTGVSPPMGAQILWKKTGVSPPMGAQIM